MRIILGVVTIICINFMTVYGATPGPAANARTLVYDTKAQAQAMIDRIDSRLGFPVPGWDTISYAEPFETKDGKWMVDIVPCAGTPIAELGMQRRVVDVRNEILTNDEKDKLVIRPEQKPDPSPQAVGP